MELTNYFLGITSKYEIDPEDVSFCCLVNSGWGKYEAMYFSYKLSYFDQSKLNLWYREHLKARPGILRLQKDMAEQERAAKKELSALKDKLKKTQARKSPTGNTSSDSGEAPMTKEELDSMYISIMRDPNADAKTKMDAGKGWASNHPEVKMEQRDEDQRLNFFLPANCHYCDRCKNCELKGELEKRGCSIRAKKTSPYLWELVQPEEADNINA